jgi:ssDNA-binding Zn-finger/Zn-ribbon topoisomerase 1
MKHFAALAAEGREALCKQDTARLSKLMDENFDTRRSICRLPDGKFRWWKRRIDVARVANSQDQVVRQLEYMKTKRCLSAYV